MAMISVEQLTKRLNEAPEEVEFSEVISLIDNTFIFTPSAFTNGEVSNDAGQNNGSCKLLALGRYLNLSQAHTLALFGRYYREDVLQHPNGNDHANIRNFMVTGHEGVVFDTFPLTPKAE